MMRHRKRERRPSQGVVHETETYISKINNNNTAKAPQTRRAQAA
jgi:hypothetical protein